MAKRRRGSVTAAQLLQLAKDIILDHGEDVEVVFTSNYGDRCRTEQVHFLKGEYEDQEIEESGYSDSGWALKGSDDDRDDPDGDDYEKVIVLS
jgi:hypothetical protein